MFDLEKNRNLFNALTGSNEESSTEVFDTNKLFNSKPDWPEVSFDDYWLGIPTKSNEKI